MAKGTVNKVILVGNLGADPETRYTANEMAITKVRLATTEVRRTRDSGETQEHTEWHRVTLFGKLGEIAAQYLRKGAKVYIEGKLRTTKYQGQDGQDRWSTEIVADEMTMLDGRSSGGAVPLEGDAQGPGSFSAGPAPTSRPAAKPAPAAQDFDDDIPF